MPAAGAAALRQSGIRQASRKEKASLDIWLSRCVREEEKESRNRAEMPNKPEENQASPSQAHNSSSKSGVK